MITADKAPEKYASLEHRRANSQLLLVPTPTNVDFSAIKRDLLKKVSSVEKDFLYKGVIAVHGHEVDASNASLEWIAGIKKSTANAVARTDTLKYILADNSVIDISYEVLDDIEASINDYLLEIHIGKQAIRGKVEEAATIEELPNIFEEFSGLCSNFVRLKD